MDYTGVDEAQTVAVMTEKSEIVNARLTTQGNAAMQLSMGFTVMAEKLMRRP